MDSRTKKSILRVGLGSSGAGESHTPSSDGGRPVYTEGPLIARREERKEEEKGERRKERKGSAKKRADRKPVVLLTPLERYPHTDEDSEDFYTESSSNLSLDSVGLPAQSGRTTPLKRRLLDETDEAPSTSKATVLEPKRGRGRPPTTGQYVGLSKAQADYNREKEEALRLQAEEEIAEAANEARWSHAFLRAAFKDSDLSATSPSGEEAKKEWTGADITKTVEDTLKTVDMIARKSTNLKGTYQKYLKESVATIRMVFNKLTTLCTTEEVKVLEARNTRLEEQVAALRQELDEVRKKASQPTGDDMRQLLAEVSRTNAETFGNMLNARLAGLEDRLLPEPRRRPPLASDGIRDEDLPTAPASVVAPMEEEVPGPPRPKKAKGKPAKPEKTQPPVAAAAPTEASAAPTAPGPSKAKKKKKKKRPSMAAQEAAQGGATISSPGTETPWTTVGPKGGKKKGAATPSTAAPKKKKKPRLRVPATAAALETARRAISIAEFDIPQVRYRRARTGGCLLTIAGEGAGKKADAFAARLKTVLPQEVRVGRPAACAEMRVAGLDDSVTAAEIKEAVAVDGECLAGDVRVGPMREGPRGDGSCWIRLPAAAAKKLSSSGRLRVGWVLARVTLAERGHVLGGSGCPSAAKKPAPREEKAPSKKARQKPKPKGVRAPPVSAAMETEA
ncbi:translation initiation factor IF-2-like [Aricia agestis]|uniref:translation initiation factor IF-2-like n=1 Tax=Aricia agestis TaxID=91739 RepID=UPI001C207995|nr:translation initiation factor IF-2-like [Aricia agestis]